MTQARDRSSKTRTILRATDAARAAIRLALVAGLSFALASCQSKNDLAPGSSGSARPAAAFAQDRTQGTPGLEVQFTDGSTGDITEFAWDFDGAGTSSSRNPLVRFDDPGVYTVELMVRGPGGTSRLTKTALIEVADSATAGFDCLPKEGFAPLTVACTDSSTGASRIDWDFGDGTTATGANPVHVYSTTGPFTVTQTARSAGGDDVATLPVVVHPLSISADLASGTQSAPADVRFRADVGGVPGLAIWMVDGKLAGNTSRTLDATLRTPGTHSIAVAYSQVAGEFTGYTEIDYVVGYGPAQADFELSPGEGTGPLTVAFSDLSSGAITRWDWDFGDGHRCTFPAPALPSSVPACDAADATHVYSAIGSYDVVLTVTGPGATADAPAIVRTFTLPDAVRVLMLDASFESQVANGAIGGAWTALRPVDATASATHLALSTGSGAGEAGMPTHGSKWAVLDGLGTNGATPVASVENGIAQEFLRPFALTVLELDYALLFAEPPAGNVLDAVTATVTHVPTNTTIEIPSARTDSHAAYHGVSTRYPSRDGSVMRTTETFTAALDLAQAFPAAGADDHFVLTIRVGNAGNGFRSPRAYVDQVRFTFPTAVAQVADFSTGVATVVAGQPVDFTDESCVNLASGCQVPTSWRWDFGTSRLATPPASSGSRAQSPTYTFPAAGTYDVRLRVARAQAESEAVLTLNVLAGAVADFAIAEAAPYAAPATLHFGDASSFDPADPIVAWSWDFAGFGSSTAQTPSAVTIGQAGDHLIRLDVRTQSGLTSHVERVVKVE